MLKRLWTILFIIPALITGLIIHIVLFIPFMLYVVIHWIIVGKELNTERTWGKASNYIINVLTKVTFTENW